MDRPSLKDIVESSVINIKLLSDEVALGTRPASQMERVLFYLCQWYRIGANGRLLCYADVKAFHEHLARSGEARRRMLRLRASQGLPFGRFSGTAQYGAVCDALAAGADEVACEIAQLSCKSLLGGEELEEDFYYGRFIHWLAEGPGAPEREAARILEEFGRVVGGDVPAQLSICEALLARDQRGFDVSLHTLIEERAAYFRAKARALSAKDEAYETNRFVFVEGLALVRMAERRGLSAAPEYKFIPGLVRMRAAEMPRVQALPPRARPARTE